MSCIELFLLMLEEELNIFWSNLGVKFSAKWMLKSTRLAKTSLKSTRLAKTGLKMAVRCLNVCVVQNLLMSQCYYLVSLKCG